MPKIICSVDCVDIVDMAKVCLLKSEYFSYENFNSSVCVDNVDFVDVHFSGLHLKKVAC